MFLVEFASAVGLSENHTNWNTCYVYNSYLKCMIFESNVYIYCLT